MPAQIKRLFANCGCLSASPGFFPIQTIFWHLGLLSLSSKKIRNGDSIVAHTRDYFLVVLSSLSVVLFCLAVMENSFRLQIGAFTSNAFLMTLGRKQYNTFFGTYVTNVRSSVKQNINE
jgi:hypothetical protein